MNKIKVLDLFAGIGGFSLGFKRFSADGFYPFEIVGSVEIDGYAASTLVSSLQRQGCTKEEATKRVICGDIRKEKTRRELYTTCPDVDIIIGGPPCQSFSSIGPRSGSKEKQKKFANDERNYLFEHYLEIVSHYRPIFFVFENVTGITTKKDVDGKKFIDIITDRFEELGYTIGLTNGDERQRYVILNAADYGVPQLRKRVFIVGNRLGIKNPYPEKTHCPAEIAPDKGLLPYVTLKDAIGDLPEVFPKMTLTPARKGVSLKEITPERKKYINNLNRDRNNGLDPAPYHWDCFHKFYNEGPKERKKFLQFIKPTNNIPLTGHIARGQQETDILLFKGMDEGMSSRQLINSSDPRLVKLASLIKYKMDSFKDKYKKLAWNEPSGTIFAHMQKDGNRFIHPDSKQGRTLTVREAARVQSFPDDYTIEAPGNVRYKYIGNAVPPLLSMAIANATYVAFKDLWKTDLNP